MAKLKKTWDIAYNFFDCEVWVDHEGSSMTSLLREATENLLVKLSSSEKKLLMQNNSKCYSQVWVLVNIFGIVINNL